MGGSNDIKDFASPTSVRYHPSITAISLTFGRSDSILNRKSIARSAAVQFDTAISKVVAIFRADAAGAPVTGHYTAVAWANTYEVGCGYADFKSATPSDFPYTKIIVCNYGPGGNLVAAGSSMYAVGPTCSACPAGTSCVNFLCKD